MIRNERQYRITKAQAARFKKLLDAFASGLPKRPGVHPRLVRAERDALKSQLGDLLAEIQEYERLKSGKVKVISVGSFDALPDGLIKARIAVGLTQKELAQSLSVKEQQVQRYEATGYRSASFGRLMEVAHALGVQVREEIRITGAESGGAGRT